MRLIDADALVAKIWEQHKETEESYDLCADELKGVYCEIVSLIDEQTTAYDVDEIVQQIEQLRMRYFLTLANTGDKTLDVAYEKVCRALDNAIEIVRAGEKHDK